jgi:MoaA/NifB/PqqE/SkfB family radical SAM enzyme
MSDKDMIGADAKNSKPADAFQGRFCPKPFENMAINADGSVRMCCGDWLPTPIGNVRENTLSALWNSTVAQDIRASILDGTFRYCDHTTCPDLVKNTLPLREEVVTHKFDIATSRTRLPHGPRSIGMGYDNTCNLKCPTCRPEIIALRGDALAEAERVQQQVLQLLPDVEFLLITGTGDALASRLYRSFLRNFDGQDWPRVRITLMTNGLLFTPRMWESLRSAHAAIRGISVSVDAATADTYAVNRGGDFNRLITNLAFAGDLVAAGALDHFELSFVVQRNNFREMPQFVRLGLDLGATAILFQKLIHWDRTYPREVYLDAAVHRQGHPDHAEFLATLRSIDLADSRVDLSNLDELRAHDAVTG